ncbi:hypothetical protein GDZ32_06325 [Lactobacillus helveticus]|uniref:Uncharacterized protein n=1 Tax=Lactobacillus helveticus TaxID=1587 RepID=A0A6A7K2U2_LACHE|nr:hypothetical protein [Lactobacillus helveticus]
MTDKLHEKFCFRLDNELITQKKIKKIFKQTKKEKKYAEKLDLKKPKKLNIISFRRLFLFLNYQIQDCTLTRLLFLIFSDSF